MGTATDRIWTPWDWRKDPALPYRLPQDRRHVVLVEGLDEASRRDGGPATIAMRARSSTAVSPGHVFVVVASPAVFVDMVRVAGSVAHRWHPHLVPALRVERQADLYDNDGVRALCSVSAQHRAMVVSPREKIALGLPGVVPKAWGLGTGYNLVRDFVDLVIVQGPTGADAWPLHPAWVREIRDECADGVAALAFMGWGEWKLGSTFGREHAIERVLLANGHAIVPHRVADDSTAYERANWGRLDPQMVARVGADRSGRLLDGREHLDLPEGL